MSFVQQKIVARKRFDNFIENRIENRRFSSRKISSSREPQTNESATFTVGTFYFPFSRSFTRQRREIRMEEPTKSDIDAIFKRLKSLPANKVRSFARGVVELLRLDLFRLRSEESDLGVRHLRRVPLHRLFRSASRSRRSFVLHSFDQSRHQLGLAATPVRSRRSTRRSQSENVEFSGRCKSAATAMR